MGSRHGHPPLNHRGRRWLLAAIGTARLTRQRRRPVLVTSRKGWLVHRYRSGALVYPNLLGMTPEHYESVVLDTFCHRYKPSSGDTVVDVGAGIGEDALTFSPLVGDGGRVVCIEAHPRTFERLTAVIELNRLRNVEAVQIAVADRAGEVRISDESTRYPVNTLIQDGGDAVIRTKASVAVPAETLDAIYERFDLERVDLLKMNIEGAERYAIDGWNEALRRTERVAIACHDFVLQGKDGASPDFATFDLVRAAVEDAGLDVTTRLDDPKPWNRYCVYGARR